MKSTPKCSILRSRIPKFSVEGHSLLPRHHPIKGPARNAFRAALWLWTGLLSVVCPIRAPCLNRLTDLDAIWQVDLWGSRTHCVRWGNGRFRGWTLRQNVQLPFLSNYFGASSLCDPASVHWTPSVHADGVYVDYYTGESAAAARAPQIHVHVLRRLHHLRLLLHSQPLHWCHHRQLQHAETQSNRRPVFLNKYLSLFNFYEYIRERRKESPTFPSLLPLYCYASVCPSRETRFDAFLPLHDLAM